MHTIISYRSIDLFKSIVILLLCALFYMPSLYAQKTGGKKLQTTEKASPTEMKEGKLKGSKRSKTRINPNKTKGTFKIFKPAKWDWDKIMWFRAKKSDYKTYKYKPNKETEYNQYLSGPNYKSESREPGDSDVKLKRPLIPYDARIPDKGPVLIKKQKVGKVDINEGGPRVPTPSIGIIYPEETTYRKKEQEGHKKIDGDKLYVKRGDDDRKPFDNDKLYIASRPDYSDTKMDFDKLMTVRISKPEKRSLHDDKLLVTVPKIERSKLHGDKLLTVEERHYPTATMKRISADIAKYDGEWERYVKVQKDSHPGTLHMSANGHRVPWLKRTQISISLFWDGLWDSNIQPSYVTDKKPKLRRDKNEGKIWDNSVHPDEWRKAEEKPESGQN